MHLCPFWHLHLTSLQNPVKKSISIYNFFMFSQTFWERSFGKRLLGKSFLGKKCLEASDMENVKCWFECPALRTQYAVMQHNALKTTDVVPRVCPVQNFLSVLLVCDTRQGSMQCNENLNLQWHNMTMHKTWSSFERSANAMRYAMHCNWGGVC